MSTTKNQPKTLAELMAEIESLKAKNAQLEANQKNTAVTVSVKKFGQGTLSATNVTGRFPVSVHANQVQKFTEAAQKMVQAIKDPKVQEDMRCAAIAYEYAMKTTGFTEVPQDGKPKSANRVRFETEWEAGYKVAQSAPDLRPSNPKWIDPKSVAAILQPVTIG